MFDLVIRGGSVVTPAGVGAFDIGVKGETIAAVAAPGALAGIEARRLIDAAGRIVMPGGIDPHVHMGYPFQLADGTTMMTRGPDHVGMAALYGGTTTVIDFAFVLSNDSVANAIQSRDKAFDGICACDWAYHLMLHTDPPPRIMHELGEAIGAGYPTVKVFMTNWPHRKDKMIDLGDIWELFKVLSRHGGMGVIHAEDDDIVRHMHGRLVSEGKVRFEHIAEVHNQLSEDLSFRRVIRLAESIPGTALYMMHVSAAGGVSAIREARRRGVPVYGESLHQYLLFTSEDYKRPNGQIYHTYPSIKSKEDQIELWAGTRDGSISCIATDELCCSLKEKTVGDRIDNITGGNAGVEPRLAVMYTEMVVRRGYTLREYVDLISTNAARLMGLYPRKGAIAAGSDADITILDPSRRGKITAARLHESDYTPWEGHEIYAWPVTTILRGKVVVENDIYLGKPGDGRQIKRKLPADVLAGRYIGSSVAPA